MRLPRLTAVVLGCIVAGCTLDPDYNRPSLPVSQGWPADAAPAATPMPVSAPLDVSADAIGWRDFFKDPQLQRLIEIALKNNRDLRVAILNVEAAQAQFDVQRSNLFPHINLSGAAEYEGLSSTGSAGSAIGGASSSASGATSSVGAGSSSVQASGSQGGTLRYYTAGIGFTSYELDLFGRLRSLSRQAFEQYLGYAETRRSTQITLVSEVATGYLTLLADRELLRVTQETFNSQSQSYKLTKLMFDEGTTTVLSLKQAETAVDAAQANLAQYKRQVAQDEHAVTLLLGQTMPSDLPRSRGIDNQGIITDLPGGLPSDLLNRRPDIIAAEHNLLAANANIGAARAAFFPSITLTASDGVASYKLNKLFTSGATTWSFAPQLSLPIFTAGENEANLDLAKVEKNTYVAQYEKAIQTAFSEVSDALAAKGTYVDQITAQQALVAAYDDSYKLSELRFRSGVDSFLSALDSQRSLYASQQTLISLKQAQLANLVTLYKALGGGWDEQTKQAGLALKRG